MLYFYIMKRFLAYYLVAVTLLTGVTSMFAPRSLFFHTPTDLSVHHQPSSNTRPSFVTTIDLFLSAGVNNEQIRLSNSGQNFSYRLLPSQLHAFRMFHSAQVVRQKFFMGTTASLLNSSRKQLDGYYLYHLRKLLI